MSMPNSSYQFTDLLTSLLLVFMIPGEPDNCINIVKLFSSLLCAHLSKYTDDKPISCFHSNILLGHHKGFQLNTIIYISYLNDINLLVDFLIFQTLFLSSILSNISFIICVTWWLIGRLRSKETTNSLSWKIQINTLFISSKLSFIHILGLMKV